jgi:phosphomannomutase / phosphoglucomutase
MAKKVTVGEIARRAELGIKDDKKAPLDLKRLGVALLMGASVGIALLAGAQALNVMRSQWAVAGTKRVAEQIATELTEQVKQARAAVEKAVASPNVVELLSSSDGFNYEYASTRAKALVPTAVDADLLQGADVATAIGGKFAAYGFAKSDVLLEAQETGRLVPAQLHFEPSTKTYTLVIAEPVKRGEGTLGYLLAKFPTGDLKAKIDSGAGGGMLSIMQTGVYADTTMISAGDGSPEQAERVQVPGSRLSLTWSGRPAFTMIPADGWVKPALISLLGLGSFALLAFLRSRPQLFADVAAKLKSSKEEAPVPSKPEPSEYQKQQKAKETQAKLDAIRAQEAATSSKSDSKDDKPSVLRRGVPNVQVDQSIFRAYDIRGVVGKTLDDDVANLLGRALGSEVIALGKNEMIVARDGRLSGPSLVKALIDGIRATGCNVIDVGAVPTPMLYFATYQFNTGSGVMVTGSHNPPDYNGFKMMIDGHTLAEQDIQKLAARIRNKDFASGVPGSVQSMNVSGEYVERISSDIQLETPLRVVVDAGNGIAGMIAPKLLQSIGCDVEPLYCEVDGNFPNHHPDPSDPKNLRDLTLAVKQMNADVGIAFDGDGDRLGVVTRTGKMIYPDRLLMLFAKDVLTRVPGASIIYDVKCTGAIAPVVRGAGGIPVMWKTGHSLIKGKMKELDAALAGEMSGHFFFKERWYGFDDGLYAACRFLEILAASGLDADELMEEFPDAVSTPEIKIEMTEGEHYRYIERFVKSAKFEGARLTTIDGVRADFDDGWGLVRCSNTTPCLVLRFEGQSDAALRRVQQVFKVQMLAIDANLAVPF